MLTDESQCWRNLNQRAELRKLHASWVSTSPQAWCEDLEAFGKASMCLKQISFRLIGASSSVRCQLSRRSRCHRTDLMNHHHSVSLSHPSHSPHQGYTQLSVLINSPPYGGHVVASPTSGTAALDAFVLESLEWTDEADDLPLSYTFSYANGQARLASSHARCCCHDRFPSSIVTYTFRDSLAGDLSRQTVHTSCRGRRAGNKTAKVR